MNPYDAINNDTKKNYDNQAKKVQKSHSRKRTTKVTRANGNKSAGKRKPRSVRKSSTQSVMNKSQKARLKRIYSTDRINVYVLLHLKALQIISGDKSRSDLEEKMIRIVEPKIVNSTGKRAKYRQLLKYAVKGVELKNRMK